MVTVAVGGKSVTAAVMVLPGTADRSATLHLGYGRTFNGRICAGAGFDFYPLRGGDAMNIMPPLCVTSGEIDEILSVLDRGFGQTARDLGVE